MNNPVKYNDPTGHAFDEGTGGGGNSVAGDVSLWLVQTLNATAEQIEFMSIAYLWDLGTSTMGATALLSQYEFYMMVRDGSPTDYKDEMKSLVGDKVQIAGEWYEYSVPGNIAFGFEGRVVGYPPPLIHAGAGAAQLADYHIRQEGELGPVGYGFDTTDDYYAIELGEYIYDRGYTNDGCIAVAEVDQLLSNFEHRESLAVVPPPTGSPKQNPPAFMWQRGDFVNTQSPPVPSFLFPSY